MQPFVTRFFLLALLWSYWARADSAWDNWQGGDPFRTYGDARDGGFSSAPREDGIGSRFERSGPLSEAAAERADSDYRDLNGASQHGASQITQQPSLAACTAGRCTPAQRAAALARASAQTLVSTASRKLHEEYSYRETIQRSIQTGMGKEFGSKDAEHFNRIFNEKRFPSKDDIAALHPKLRDAAQALRTSRAIETFLQQSIEKNSVLSDKAGSMGAKNSLNEKNLRSLGDAGKSDKAAAARSDSQEWSAGGASANLGHSGNGPREDPLGSLFTGSKPVETRSAGLDAEDKSLLAGMLRDLQSDLGKRMPGLPGLTPGGAEPASGGTGKPFENFPTTSSSQAGAGFPALRDGERPAGGTGQGRHPASDEKTIAGFELSLKDISIFARVHARIEMRAARDGLVRAE